MQWGGWFSALLQLDEIFEKSVKEYIERRAEASADVYDHII